MEQCKDQKTWLGSSLNDICKGKGIWSFSVSPVIPSKYHSVLYQLPVNLSTPPKPHVPTQTLHWDEDYVRMPYSFSNVFPVVENGINTLKSRWKLILNIFSKPINSSREFEAAISKYNKNLPRFSALHNYFDEIPESEAHDFFTNCLPNIIKLALRLPDILPGNLPLLKRGHCKSLSLSQLQVSSLLANAFICTFPWRKDMMHYPGVNFSVLFSAESSYFSEKLKCIIYYFKRVTNKNPTGVITFERKHISRTNMPRWDNLENNLGNTKIHVNSSGTIEDDGLGFLQVDFANKYIGGGVLGYGCVQEEIRFLICPELIVSRLFIEQIGDSEAVIITGAERFSNYTGYADSFKWSGHHQDLTPHDDYGRLKTTISVIDATHFSRPKDQYYPSAILREVNKAYVGFSSRERDNLAPVATGNWGCGAFRGDPNLKSLIQLMASCAAGRDLIYYSFGNINLKDDFYNMYLFLANNRISIKLLWNFLKSFSSSSVSHENLYSYIQQSFFDSKHQPSIKNYFSRKLLPEIPSTSSTSTSSPQAEKKHKLVPECKDTCIEIEPNLMDLDSIEDDIIPDTPPHVSEMRFQKISKSLIPASKEEISKKMPNNHDEIVGLLGFDGNANKSKEKSDDNTLLSELDKLRKNSKSNILEKVEKSKEISQNESFEISGVEKSQKRKITDYFTKHEKS
ncbi:unnamed protein product [Brassicogethes aeneus]|uniref:poly(ADP-ribose) glycohydrolase n=1 Tax=Brassicogethes aeneus TaxID=1431903 RepID=A0A9P0BB62_BRAAE|nr:unnamed protein product [Brassicogethes aeneus]